MADRHSTYLFCPLEGIICSTCSITINTFNEKFTSSILRHEKTSDEINHPLSKRHSKDERLVIVKRYNVYIDKIVRDIMKVLPTDVIAAQNQFLNYLGPKNEEGYHFCTDCRKLVDKPSHRNGHHDIYCQEVRAGYASKWDISTNERKVLPHDFSFSVCNYRHSYHLTFWKRLQREITMLRDSRATLTTESIEAGVEIIKRRYQEEVTIPANQCGPDEYWAQVQRLSKLFWQSMRSIYHTQICHIARGRINANNSRRRRFGMDIVWIDSSNNNNNNNNNESTSVISMSGEHPLPHPNQQPPHTVKDGSDDAASPTVVRSNTAIAIDTTRKTSSTGTATTTTIDNTVSIPKKRRRPPKFAMAKAYSRKRPNQHENRNRMGKYTKTTTVVNQTAAGIGTSHDTNVDTTTTAATTTKPHQDKITTKDSYPVAANQMILRNIPTTVSIKETLTPYQNGQLAHFNHIVAAHYNRYDDNVSPAVNQDRLFALSSSSSSLKRPHEEEEKESQKGNDTNLYNANNSNSISSRDEYTNAVRILHQYVEQMRAPSTKTYSE